MQSITQVSRDEVQSWDLATACKMINFFFSSNAFGDSSFLCQKLATSSMRQCNGLSAIMHCAQCW